MKDQDGLEVVGFLQVELREPADARKTGIHRRGSGFLGVIKEA
jgi:hypothetical protein